MGCLKLSYYENDQGDALEKNNFLRKVGIEKKGQLEKNCLNYYAFGALMPGRHGSSESYRYGAFGYEGDTEVKGTGNSYTTEFRQYDPRLGRWLSPDPYESAYPGWTPYKAFYDNPIYWADPTGGNESTHTDEDGNVIAVYNDGDKNVYTHENGTTKEQLDKKNEESGISWLPFNLNKGKGSLGGTNVGETVYWDEFIDPETGDVFQSYKIDFQLDFDPIVKEKNEEAQGLDLKEIASKSSPGGDFDIKKDYPKTGGKLNGKFVTSRSAGNYLAGYNAQGGTYLGAWISFETFQKLAGAVHVLQRKLTKTEIITIASGYFHFGEAPTYGEIPYQYRMSKSGWDQAEKDDN